MRSIKILVLGLVLAKRGKRLSSGKMAMGDTINLATEAGIDVTLYWNGKTYRLDTPQEEP